MKHGTRLDVAVRFAETDAYGHMNNRVPFIYFEDVRTLMLEETGYSLAEDGIIVVADAQCNYIRQVYPRTRLAVYAYPVHVGSASCDVHYAAFDEQDGHRWYKSIVPGKHSHGVRHIKIPCRIDSNPLSFDNEFTYSKTTH